MNSGAKKPKNLEKPKSHAVHWAVTFPKEENAFLKWKQVSTQNRPFPALRHLGSRCTSELNTCHIKTYYGNNEKIIP